MADDEDLEGVGTGERKAYLRILAWLACADGDVAQDELEVLHLAANDLKVALGERDLDGGDLTALAEKVTHPGLQEKLLGELRRMAEADQKLEPDELATIKFLATRWGCFPPAIAGVDWSQVEVPWSD